METVHLYYAAFSAALMAKAEPLMAQQFAYQLAYLADHPELFGGALRRDKMPKAKHSSITPSTPPIPSTIPVAATPPHQVPRRWPINPLNHVDWIHGGRLNERWRTQQQMTPGPSVRPAQNSANAAHNTETQGMYRSNHMDKAPASTQQKPLADAILSHINHAILCALVQSDPDAQPKFAVGLFTYLQSQQPEHTSFRSHYWLMMHAMRCYLFGTRLQWDETYAANTEIRQSQHPMYPVIADFLGEHHNMDQTSLLKQLMAQMAFLPPILQSQCLGLGIAYRPMSVDDAIGSGAGILPGCFNKTALHTAVQWIHSGLEAGL